MLLQSSISSSGVLGNALQITDVVWQSINDLLTGIVGRFPFIIAGVLVAALFFVLARLVKSVLFGNDETRPSG